MQLSNQETQSKGDEGSSSSTVPKWRPLPVEVVVIAVVSAHGRLQGVADDDEDDGGSVPPGRTRHACCPQALWQDDLSPAAADPAG